MRRRDQFLLAEQFEEIEIGLMQGRSDAGMNQSHQLAHYPFEEGRQQQHQKDLHESQQVTVHSGSFNPCLRR
ncbi:MAG: hypothetical protein BWY77_01250 [bacterium ADurb.Bin431]|nr:MAG: hypothetical protein BWY77_01250 [bacterium ADurb.Bin431]